MFKMVLNTLLKPVTVSSFGKIVLNAGANIEQINSLNPLCASVVLI